MKITEFKKLVFLKIFGFAIALILAFMVLLPFFFKEKINSIAQDYLNEQVQTGLSFQNINLTFFRHFPSLTVSLDELLILGKEGFEIDTLVYTKDLSFGIKLISLLGDNIQVNGIYLKDARINVLMDELGNPNYDIFKSTQETQQETSETDSTSLRVEIKSIKLLNSSVFYKDSGLDFSFSAENFDYSGKGKLENEIFDLSSNLKIPSFELSYEGIPYFAKKRITANLKTKINTESTALTFERNHLKINDLPVDFVGKLEFLSGGYDMNFILESVDSKFKDMLSLVPEDMYPWLKETKVRGKGDLRGSLQGLYLPSENLMPNLLLNLKVYDGYLNHSESTIPLKDLNVDFNITIPELSIEKTKLDLDSIYFSLGDGFLKGHFKTDGLDPAFIQSNLLADVDLGLLDKAVGLYAYDMKGRLKWNFSANGIYSERQIPGTFRNPKYETASIPVFDFISTLSEGYFKWTDLPEPVQNISWNLRISAPDSIYQNMGIFLENFQFSVLDNIVKGHFNIGQLKGMDVDAAISTKFNLSEVEKFYPLEEGFILKGLFDIDLQAKGSYEPEKKLFPVMDSKINLREGFIKTSYSEHPIEDLSLELDIQSDRGSYSDLKFDLKPIHFRFVDHPFSLTANLENLDDIKYDIQSSGRIDLGKLYGTFGIDGHDVNGYLITDLNLKGRQSDAIQSRIQYLDNKGFVEMEKIQINSELFPYPIDILSGRFKIDQDKIQLEDFLAYYVDNEFRAKGYLFNIINYLSDPGEELNGKLEINSGKININDFMFFAENDSPTIDTIGVVHGVVMIPQNIHFNFSAQVDTILYDDFVLKKFKGEITIDKGLLTLEKTGFEMIGADFKMDAKYHPINPYHAEFDYNITAKAFDIQRAYNEITMFKEIVTAAAYATGTASLDYQLSGRLDANMQPVMPSIKGEGVFGLDNIKLKGFKLMNTIANRTENSELQDPDLADVSIKSSIANNLITIERTRMRIAGFRPRFEGQVSLDGDMSIAFRLGLPPLGIFGIPIKITGNAENFNMEIGKITEGDELEEVKDVDVVGEIEGN
ncbi:AsmA protein [Aquiflexum balticum DSM 16537]|uniref:AsmA protein n=1 Tax=Aquiflexum balticum DSM 16537 TaxID=758820 RepID=A0A1W2H6H3_9BACT|nr:AsmA-like C-terminal region-containing protein [Aquiflexum balticum]SMD44535.1 AsmA protein [Aquiflexum balticum DSM 16537]